MIISKEAYNIASYWYACNYHNGEYSKLYLDLCKNPYFPSPLTEGIEDEKETPYAIDYYIALVKKHEGDYPEPDLELIHYGDIDILQSHKGCLVSIYFEYVGNDSQALDSFKEAFWDEIDYIEEPIADCILRHATYVNERLEEIFDQLPPFHLLASNTIDNEEVVCWLKVTI